VLLRRTAMSDEIENAVILDDDLPPGFDPDDVDDQLFDGMPPEYDPARGLTLECDPDE
jgi:hypothetical protein